MRDQDSLDEQAISRFISDLPFGLLFLAAICVFAYGLIHLAIR